MYTTQVHKGDRGIPRRGIQYIFKGAFQLIFLFQLLIVFFLFLFFTERGAIPATLSDSPPELEKKYEKMQPVYA